MDSTDNSNGATRETETSPLLSLPADAEQAQAPQPNPGFFSRNRRSIYLLFVVVAGLDFCVYMVNLPLTRVYESIICYAHYAATEPSRFPSPGSIPEALCKIDSVQEELALIRGYEYLCMSLPG
jgi:hypothetical protein